MKSKKLAVLYLGLLLAIFTCVLSSNSLLYGQEIVYIADSEGSYDIWAINSDGTGKINLSIISHDPNSEFRELDAKWSPDGTAIVFRSDKSGLMNIWIMDATGQNDYLLTNSNFAEYDPFWSPDGNKIYFARNTRYSSGGGCSPCPYWEIFVFDLLTGVATQLTNNSYREMAPVVSPDGNFVVYTKAENAGDCCNPTDIWIMDADGSNQQLFYGSNDGSYEWPSDWGKINNKILFQKQYSTNPAPYEIVSIDLSGSEILRLTMDNYNDYHATFSPDDQKIVFTSNRGSSDDLWIMDNDGSNLIQLTDDPGAEFWPDWKPVPIQAKVLFDDFDYSSFSDFYGRNRWYKWDGSWEYKDMYNFTRGEFIDIKSVENGSDRKNWLEFKLDKNSDLVPGTNIETTQYYNGGVYAALIQFDDGQKKGNKNKNAKNDRIIEAFWVQSSNREDAEEVYAECDFEYLPWNLWEYSWDDAKKYKGPIMWTNTYDKADPKVQDLEERVYEGSFAGKWIGLLIRVKPENSVEYLIYDCSESDVGTLIYPYMMSQPGLAPENESKMVIQVGMGNEKKLKNSYTLKVDWIIHIQDSSDYSWHEIVNLVNQLRDDDNFLPRLDTTDPLAQED